mmetsp:Transcript_22252/g.21489  ORF Transcript_22252/g.21489 Transcript_22252/m.21489 type:complete len:155 (-) Transcript_22252:224-688(-)
MNDEAKNDGAPGEDLAAKLLKGAEGGAPDVDDKNKISNKDLALVFHQARDAFPNRPFHEEGNPEMYTKENMDKRNALKENDTVMEAINDFMQEFRGAASGKVTKDEYFRVFMSIGNILRPGLEQDILQNIIKEDFDQDSMDKVVPPQNEEEAKQ